MASSRFGEGPSDRTRATGTSSAAYASQREPGGEIPGPPGGSTIAHSALGYGRPRKSLYRTEYEALAGLRWARQEAAGVSLTGSPAASRLWCVALNLRPQREEHARDSVRVPPAAPY